MGKNLDLEIKKALERILDLVEPEERKEISSLIKNKLKEARTSYQIKVLNELQIIKQNLEKTKK